MATNNQIGNPIGFQYPENYTNHGMQDSHGLSWDPGVNFQPQEEARENNTRSQLDPVAVQCALGGVTYPASEAFNVNPDAEGSTNESPLTLASRVSHILTSAGQEFQGGVNISNLASALVDVLKNLASLLQSYLPAIT